MEYALGLIVFAVLPGLLYRMLKFSDANRCARMNSRQFEEAKRASPAAGVMIAIQKAIDPSHRVEYVQQTEESREDRANPAEPPPENG